MDGPIFQDLLVGFPSDVEVVLSPNPDDEVHGGVSHDVLNHLEEELLPPLLDAEGLMKQAFGIVDEEHPNDEGSADA